MYFSACDLTHGLTDLVISESFHNKVLPVLKQLSPQVGPSHSVQQGNGKFSLNKIGAEEMAQWS